MSAGSVIPTVADVKDAYERLRDVVVRTPLLRNDELDKRIAAEKEKKGKNREQKKEKNKR